MAFLSEEQLHKLDFKSIGSNVLISEKASIYFPENVEIGNNVRIDDFCIISSSNKCKIGNYIHIGCYASIIGQGDVIIEDFCGISGRVSIYSSNDDYTGLYMTNPTVPSKYTGVTHGLVHIKKHSIIGAGSIILPNTILNEGTSVSALSLLSGELESFSIYSGNPAKKIAKRQKRFLKYEQFVTNN